MEKNISCFLFGKKKKWDNSNSDRAFVLHESNPGLIPEQNWADINMQKFWLLDIDTLSFNIHTLCFRKKVLKIRGVENGFTGMTLFLYSLLF